MTRFFKYILFISITTMALLIADSSLSGDIKSPWVINNTSASFLKYVEFRGGRVASVHPQKGATIYLSDELRSELQAEGYQLNKEAQITAADSLQDDLQIGDSYHSYEATLSILDSLHSEYPTLTFIKTIGRTVEDREIKAIALSKNISGEETEPELCFIGNMHGNEIITQEIMLCAIDSLLRAYGQTGRVTQLLDSAEIWFIPNMNFDGAAANSRFNANGKDLNRDFPDREFETNDPAGKEPETQAVMEWAGEHNFVLSANFHAGALLVNYPWDKNLSGASGYAATADDSLFIRLALSYAKYNPRIKSHSIYDNGVVNGAVWYEIDGSMQDWNYYYMNGFEVTVELSDTLRPAEKNIRKIWRENSNSLFTYIEQAHTGLRGVVTDSAGGFPLFAKVEVTTIDQPVFSDSTLGDYYRLLQPGSYTIRFSAAGYLSKIYSNIEIDSGAYSTLNVRLQKETYYSLNGLIVDSLSGSPIDRARLFFYRKGIVQDSAMTAVDGSFQLELAQGDYQVTVEKEGYFQVEDYLSLHDNMAVRYALVAVLPTMVRGVVSTSDGRAVGGAVVYCQSRTDTLLNNGEFMIDSLRADRINLFIYKYGYKTAHIDTAIINGDTLTLSVFLTAGFNVFFDDFEESSSRFTGNGDWGMGLPEWGPDNAWSGNGVFGTNLSGDYSTGPALSTLTTPFLFVQGIDKPAVEFYHWYNIEDGYDGGNIKISSDEGKSWRLINPEPDYSLRDISAEYKNPLSGEPAYSGKYESWERVMIKLDDYKKFPAILLRFEFGADMQKEAPGWYIDHFKVFSANAVTMDDDALPPNKYDLSMLIYPNPANPSATVAISGIKKGGMVDISIYSITGQKIINRQIERGSNGTLLWKWNGKNSSGRSVASGLYFIRIKNLDQFLSAKILLIQ